MCEIALYQALYAKVARENLGREFTLSNLFLIPACAGTPDTAGSLAARESAYKTPAGLWGRALPRRGDYCIATGLAPPVSSRTCSRIPWLSGKLDAPARMCEVGRRSGAASVPLPWSSSFSSS